MKMTGFSFKKQFCRQYLNICLVLLLLLSLSACKGLDSFNDLNRVLVLGSKFHYELHYSKDGSRPETYNSLFGEKKRGAQKTLSPKETVPAHSNAFLEDFHKKLLFLLSDKTEPAFIEPKSIQRQDRFSLLSSNTTKKTTIKPGYYEIRLHRDRKTLKTLMQKEKIDGILYYELSFTLEPKYRTQWEREKSPMSQKNSSHFWPSHIPKHESTILHLDLSLSLLDTEAKLRFNENFRVSRSSDTFSVRSSDVGKLNYQNSELVKALVQDLFEDLSLRL